LRGVARSRPGSRDHREYDQIVYADRGGDGLFLMCKRGSEAEARDISLVDEPEALPRWERVGLSASSSSRSSNPGFLRPGFEMEKRRQSGVSERWRGRMSGLRKQGSQIFRKGGV
jgi:hypothetical protein